jgi:hypothetical protein
MLRKVRRAAAVHLGMTRISLTSPRLLLAVRVVGALLLLFVGLDHYYEYSVDSYSVVPTIGTLFLLNFISAAVVGLVLLAPLNRIAPRLGPLAHQAAALSGAGIAATSLAALLISEQTKLFGFMESNYRPAIVIAIVTEAAAAIVLGALFVLTVRGARRRPARPRLALAPDTGEPTTVAQGRSA